MSPVSSVFHSEATLKKYCLTLASDFYLGLQGRADVEFWNKGLTLIQIITENKNRRASGPLQPLPSIPLHAYSNMSILDFLNFDQFCKSLPI